MSDNAAARNKKDELHAKHFPERNEMTSYKKANVGPGEFFDVELLANELEQFCDNSDAMAWAQEVTTHNQNTADYVNLGVNLERERIFGKVLGIQDRRADDVGIVAYTTLIRLAILAKFGQDVDFEELDLYIVAHHAKKDTIREASEALIEKLRPKFTPCEMRDHAPCPGVYRVYQWSGAKWTLSETVRTGKLYVRMQTSQPMRRYFGPLPDGSDIPAPEPIPE